MHETIDKLYQDYCKLKDSNNDQDDEYSPQVYMYYDESGFLNFSIHDNVGLDTQQQQTYRKDTRSRSISQVHLSSDKDIDIATFQRALLSFTFKTVYQIMTESLDFCPIWTTLDNPESTPPVYVSANWQTAKQLIVIIPPNSSKLPGVWSIANIISNGLSYGSTLLLLEQCLEDGDGVIILQPEGQYDVLETKHVKESDSISTNKLAADVERILNNMANNNEGLSLEKVFHDLSNLHSEKTIQEQARAIRGSFYQNCVHVNDDIRTRRNKVAWDVLIKKSKATSINILSHRSSYASAIKSYRYALHSLSQAYRLRICAFMNGTKEDYLGVRSYMNISSSSIVLNDLFIFDSEEKQTPLLTTFHSHSRYTDEDVVVYRLGKTNNRNDELRLLDYVGDNLQTCTLFTEDEYNMWYVKHT